MKQTLVTGIILLLSTIPTAFGQGSKLTINKPADGEKVSELPIIEGTFSSPNSQVWVVVHPMTSGDYWVQQPSTVRDNGVWKVQIHVGERDTPAGTRFEIRAVVNPKKAQLSEGKTLKSWPEAEWRSQIIEIAR